MKKFLAVVMVIALIFCFCSCTKSNDNNILKTNDPLVNELIDEYAVYATFYYTKDNSEAFSGHKSLYDLKNQTDLSAFNEISGKENVDSFKAELRLSEWERQEVVFKELPRLVVYFGGGMHINLEMHTNGKFYASINTKEESAYFKIPQSVYYKVYSYYEEK